MKKPTAVIALIASALACTSAGAQPVTLVVGYSPGASYDIYARNFARHLGKHLPGNPAIVVQNMTGAGSLRSANYVFNAAPKAPFKDALLFVSDKVKGFNYSVDELYSRNLQLVRERDLCDRFGLVTA